MGGKSIMITKIAIVCMIGAAYAAPQYKSYDAPAKPSYGAPSKALKARCEFPNGGGLLNIIERKETTRIFGNMSGLTDGLHGFHVHEFGGLGNGCKDAGGHFDPLKTEDETGQYIGDLGSVSSAYGKASVEISKPEIKLSGPEEFSVLNRAMVVHADPTGGDRVMCCTIKGPGY